VQTAWSCAPGWAHEHVACTHWPGSAAIALQTPFESAGHQGSHHCYILPWVCRSPVLSCTTCLARCFRALLDLALGMYVASTLNLLHHLPGKVRNALTDQNACVSARDPPACGPCQEGGQRRDTRFHLLAEQGAAAALDHVQRRVHLIRAVYRHVELRLLIQRRKRDAQPCVRLLGSARAAWTACLPAARSSLQTPPHSHTALSRRATPHVPTLLAAAFQWSQLAYKGHSPSIHQVPASCASRSVEQKLAARSPRSPLACS